jgi:3-oxoadipate enol-lactonase
MASFAPRYRAIRIDARGWGRSDRPHAPWSPVDDLLRALAALGIDRAALIGASMGGRTAHRRGLGVSRRRLRPRPGRGHGRRLPCLGDELPRMWEEQGAALALGDRDRAHQLELDFWIRAGLGDESARLIRELADENIHVWSIDEDLVRRPQGTIDRLGQVTVPTLVVILEDDCPPIKSCGDLSASRIPGARRITVPGDHHPNLRDPHAIDRAVLGFLSEVLT